MLKNEPRLSWIEMFTCWLLKKLVKGNKLSKIDYLKCKLGIEIFLINCSKTVMVYSIAYIGQIAIEVLLFHCSFLVVRMFAYGGHAHSSFICTLLSSILFVGIPYLFMQGLLFQKAVLLVLGFLTTLSVMKYAPGSTTKNPITDSLKRKKLRNKALVINTALLGIATFTSNLLVSNLLTIASLLVGIGLLPIPTHIKNLKRTFSNANR